MRLLNYCALRPYRRSKGKIFSSNLNIRMSAKYKLIAGAVLLIAVATLATTVIRAARSVPNKATALASCT